MEEEKVVNPSEIDEEINFDEEPEDSATQTSEPIEEKGKDEGSKEMAASEVRQSSKVNREEKQKRLAHENYIKGQIDAIGVNPYTKKPIRNERDLELYKKMKTAQESGDENAVVTGYQSYIDEVSQREDTERKTRETQDQQVQAFRKAIPNADLRKKILNDPDFREIYGDIVTSGGDIVKVAKNFIRIKGLDKNPLYEEGKKMASNIFPPTASPEPPKADYSSMSESEIHEAFEKMKFGS